MASIPGLLQRLPAENRLLPVMRSLPVSRRYFLFTIEHFRLQQSTSSYNRALLVTMASLTGDLDSLSVENRLLPVIMRSLSVIRSHFLFTTDHFRSPWHRFLVFWESFTVENRLLPVIIMSLPVPVVTSCLQLASFLYPGVTSCLK